jgi:hypothetical protein
MYLARGFTGSFREIIRHCSGKIQEPLHALAWRGQGLSNHTHGMNLVSKLFAFACVLLTMVLWIVTLMTDATRGPIVAAAALTAIVAAIIAFTMLE